MSKTCNVGDDVSFEQFKDVYKEAWENGCKGITTFRASGKRYGILNVIEDEEPKVEACYIDPNTGVRTCE